MLSLWRTWTSQAAMSEIVWHLTHDDGWDGGVDAAEGLGSGCSRVKGDCRKKDGERFHKGQWVNGVPLSLVNNKFSCLTVDEMEEEIQGTYEDSSKTESKPCCLQTLRWEKQLLKSYTVAARSSYRFQSRSKLRMSHSPTHPQELLENSLRSSQGVLEENEALVKHFLSTSQGVLEEFLRNLTVQLGSSQGVLREFLRGLKGVLKNFLGLYKQFQGVLPKNFGGTFEELWRTPL